MGELYVLDAAAFINTDIFQFGTDKFMTTSHVFRELKDARSMEMAESALIGRMLIVKECSDEGLSEARKAAVESSDLPELSEADLSILALCFDLKRANRSFKLLTDDRAVQNVSRLSGFEFVSISEEPIKEVIKWGYQCPRCKRVYNSKPNFGVCTVCAKPVVKKKISGKKV
ncbi:MAG: hypothetical protein GOV15_00210 [Candidatus Diapherotrites archaeon]|nr:hypothetical protein [Candidatus Diapherotrites archaeon]